MRPLQLADIEVAMRALLACKTADRPSMAKGMVAAASAGDNRRLATGQIDPALGAGSLMAAAVRHPLAPRPDALDENALTALACVIDAVLHQDA